MQMMNIFYMKEYIFYKNVVIRGDQWMNYFESNKVREIKDLLDVHIEELNLIRNRLKRSLNDLKKSEFQTKTKQLELLLHDNDIKIMTLILLQEKVKRIIKS